MVPAKLNAFLKELLCQIAASCDPISVMHLSQTCRLPHSATYDGAVFKALLAADTLDNPSPP